MSFTVELSDGFRLSKDGLAWSAPPDRAVAVLLFGLLFQGETWIPRSEVAKNLYPDSDLATGKNALRQALFRLQKWMGCPVIESQLGGIRIVPGLFSVNVSVGNGRLAPLLEHPWVDQIRNGKSKKGREELALPFADFVRAIKFAAPYDKRAARSILVGGSDLLDSLPPELVSELLNLTRPANGGDELAFEHLASRTRLYYRSGDYPAALEGFSRLFRMARHQNSLSKLVHSAHFATITSIECGDMVGAEAWMRRYSQLGANGTNSLALIICQAAFLWNLNRRDDALDLMRSSMPLFAKADRFQSFHYWHNFSMLAAEAGDLDIAWEAIHETSRLIVPELELGRAQAVQLATANVLSAEGNHRQAAQKFERLLEDVEGPGNEIGKMYATEAFSEALAKAGDYCRAASVWASSEAMRKRAKIGSSPRVSAQKSRVLNPA